MALQSQAATLRTNSLPKGHLHSRRTHRRSKHFTQHLTCRSMPQKVQAPSHTVAKSTYPSWLRKHPHLHMAAEMARHPATPGLLFTAAGVTGCLVASEVASKLVDRTSHRVELLGDGLNRQLHQASDSIAVQTKVSQAAFQEWKGLMSGILSEEANKIQAELDHASSVVTAWQQRSAASAATAPAGSSSQAEGPANRRQLNAHPLSMPQLELPKLESGWLVDAVQQRFPEIGASNAWPTSFSLAAGSDSMSGSDDEEARSPPSPSSLASHFVNHARQLAEQLGKPTGSATMDKEASQAAPTASTLATHFMNKAKQLTGLGFGVSNFSSASRLEREPDFIQDRKQELSSPGQLPPPSQTIALLPPADKPSRLSSSMTSAASPAAAKFTTATMEASSALLPAQNPAHSASSPAAAKAVKCKQSEAALAKLEEPVASSPVQSQGASSTALDRGLPAKAQIFAASAPVQAKEPVSSTPIETSPSTAAPLAPGHRGTDSPIQPASSSAAVTGACSSSAVQPAPAQVASFNSTAVRPPTALPAPTQGSSSALPASSSSSPAAASPSAAAAAAPSPAVPSSSSVAPPVPSPAVPSSSSVAPPVPSPAVPSSSSVASPAHSPAVRSSSSVAPLAPSPAVPSSSSAAAAAAPSPAASTSALSEPSGPNPTPSDTSSLTSQAAPSSSTSSRAPILAPAIVEQPVPVAQQGVPEQTASTAQPSSTPHALPVPQRPAEVSSHAAQHSQQQSGKSTSKPVRVVRPDPTPNWRTPRPLTPPPTPVQQGHPLSAPPAAAGQSQTVPGQCNADDTENAAPHSPAGSEDTAEMFDVLNSAVDSSSLRTKTARPQSSKSGAESASKHELASPSSSSISSDDLGVTNPVVTNVTTNDRLPTTAAATAEEIDSSTAVIDSIPWGSSGIATAKGRSVRTQIGGGGGGGGATGGSTGGGGGDGGSDRPLDNNGGEDGDHVSTSPWWVKWLLAGSLVGAINLRDHIQRIPDIDEQPTEELPADETEADGIMTNIKVKEGDTAWSIAEEYGGSAAAWPEVVSSNPTVDKAKPVAGTTLQVRVRL